MYCAVLLYCFSWIFCTFIYLISHHLASSTAEVLRVSQLRELLSNIDYSRTVLPFHECWSDVKPAWVFFFLFHVIAQPGCDVPRTAHMFPICKQNTMLQTQSQLKCAVTVIWERLSSNYRSNRSACHQGDIKRIWCWHCLLSICTSVTMCFYLYSSVWKTKKQLLNSGGDLFS